MADDNSAQIFWSGASLSSKLFEWEWEENIKE